MLHKRSVFRIGDLVAILLVVALTIALVVALLGAEKGKSAEISVDGTVVALLPLNEDAVYPVEANNHRLTVRIEGGEVFVTDATCPDKVCEHTGRISAEGTSVVCAVARVCVRVRGGGESDVDYVAG